MDKVLLRDVIEWDTVTWGRAVDFWQAAHVLDIGSRGGGLSLMFAQMGCQVRCTDLENPKETAAPLHQRYGVEDRISYAAVNAVKLDAIEEYDIICFKSVLGGIGYGDNRPDQEKAVRNMYRALKPGGYLMFAENLTATPVHQLLRRKFNRWNTWRYITIAEAIDFCSDFSEVRFRCFGFFGTLGRNERQRRVLGRIDEAIDWLLPDSAKYTISVVARK